MPNDTELRRLRSENAQLRALLSRPTESTRVRALLGLSASSPVQCLPLGVRVRWGAESGFIQVQAMLDGIRVSCQDGSLRLMPESSNVLFVETQALL